MSICVFPEHQEFIQICREAEAEAHRTGEKAIYLWRGYRGVIAANLPPMTVPGLELRLMHALEKIPNKTIPETLVKKKNKKKIKKKNFFSFPNLSMYEGGSLNTSKNIVLPLNRPLSLMEIRLLLLLLPSYRGPVLLSSEQILLLLLLRNATMPTSMWHLLFREVSQSSLRSTELLLMDQSAVPQHQQ